MSNETSSPVPLERPALATPGPWRIRSDSSCSVEGPDGKLITIVCAGSVQKDAADARLIAAAPDLLAALEAYISIMKTPCLYGELPVFLREFSDQARAAIAKAKAGR